MPILELKECKRMDAYQCRDKRGILTNTVLFTRDYEICFSIFCFYVSHKVTYDIRKSNKEKIQ